MNPSSEKTILTHPCFVSFKYVLSLGFIDMLLVKVLIQTNSGVRYIKSIDYYSYFQRLNGTLYRNLQD